jgi:hypothetical protein
LNTHVLSLNDRDEPMKEAIQKARGRAAIFRRAARYSLSQPAVITSVPALLGPRRGWDMDEPWWNIRAISYLKQHLPPGGSVFEWGSGGSTVWLTNQGLSVTSIEHDEVWAANVAKRCTNVDIRHVPGQLKGRLRSEPELRDAGRHFFDEYVAQIDQWNDESLDVVIVDGFCRVECMQQGAPKVKRGGMLIVDDTDFRFLSLIGTYLPDWKAVRLSGFKRPLDFRETTFFHRPH